MTGVEMVVNYSFYKKRNTTKARPTMKGRTKGSYSENHVQYEQVGTTINLWNALPCPRR
jgi:hypothetical protein